MYSTKQHREGKKEGLVVGKNILSLSISIVIQDDHQLDACRRSGRKRKW